MNQLFRRATLGAIMSISLFGCASVHTETVINATPSEVWAVLSDPSGYKEWNPVLVPLEGELRQGEKVNYAMTDSEGKTSEVKAKVIEVVPERKLNQYGGIWGIVTFEHTWELEPVDGGTRVTQHEEYRGVYVPFWDYSWVEPAYSSVNEALKARVLALKSRIPTEDE